MQSLLRWSIENTDPNAPPVQPKKDLDPAIIDHILGKPDAVLMKEALSVAVDETRNEEDRVAALDDFEMLIEQIDNANNIQVLGMWEPIQALVKSPLAGVKTHALWIIGTALQNNPQAQIAYLDYSTESLSLIVESLQSDSSKARSKALYALSGLLKHNARAVSSLDKNGWKTIVRVLQDSDTNVKRKIPFMLNSLLVPLPPTQQPKSTLSEPRENKVHPNSHASHLQDPSLVDTSPVVLKALNEYGVVTEMAGLLESEVDEEWLERMLRLLHTYAVVCNGNLMDQDKTRIRSWLDKKDRCPIDLDKDEEAGLRKVLS